MAQTILQQAREQARGGKSPVGKTIVVGRAGASGLVADMRLRAYYPPTREFFDVADFCTAIGWQDDESTAAKSGSMTFDNTGGVVGSFLNRPGLILLVETRHSEAVAFTERERFVAWATTVTDLQQAQLTIEFYDHLVYLQQLVADFHFTKRKKRGRPGYTASEIARILCRRHKIPVNFLAKTTYKIPYFVLKQRSVYEAIAKAYAIDSVKTGKQYYVTARKGRLHVHASRKRTLELAITDEHNLRQGSFSRRLPDNFGVKTKPRGGDPTAKGNRTKARKGAGGNSAASKTAPGAVYVFGDSLAVGARPALASEMGGTKVTGNGSVGRTTAQGLTYLEGIDVTALPNTVVVFLGTNDTVAATFKTGARAIMKKLGGRRVLWANVHRAGYTAAMGRALKDIKAEFSNLEIFNFHGHVLAGRIVLAGDGIHPTSYAQVAKQLEPALKSSSSSASGRSPDAAVAAQVLFGAMEYSPRHNTIHDRDWTRASASALGAKLGSAAKELVLTVDGNLGYRQGDRVYVKMATSDGLPLRKEVFISAVSHSIQGGDFVSQVTCRWREKDVSIARQGAQIQLEAKPSSADSSSDKSDTATPSSGSFNMAQLEALAKKHGAPNPRLAAAVAMAESSGNPRANGDTHLAALGSRGLWQIYTKAHPQYDPEKLYDPDYNAQAMMAVSGGGKNWQPWTMYQNGGYRKYM